MIENVEARDGAFSPSIALWCPYCRRPFIGTVNLADGRFFHPACGRVAALDLERVSALASRTSADAWFWDRYLGHLLGEAAHGGPSDEHGGEQLGLAARPGRLPGQAAPGSSVSASDGTLTVPRATSGARRPARAFGPLARRGRASRRPD